MAQTLVPYAGCTESRARKPGILYNLTFVQPDGGERCVLGGGHGAGRQDVWGG